jgi:Zinc knuckle
MTFDPTNYTCYNCGERGHLAGNCPAKIAPDAHPKAAHHMPGDDTIRQRILRVYQPATEAEMAGLVNTWKQHYTPGAEHAMAPRMPPGFMVLLQARMAAGDRPGAADAAGWCADIREVLRLRSQASTEVRG